MPNVLSSEWSSMLTLRVTTWDIKPLDRGFLSKPWMGIAGLRGAGVSRCHKTNSSDIDISEDWEPLSIIVHARNGIPFNVCTVALHSKWSATNDLIMVDPSVICKFSFNASLSWREPLVIPPDVWLPTSEERLFPLPRPHQHQVKV